MNSPKFTILIPTWNSEAYILRAIQSITSNGWPDYEIRIMDNESADQTHALVRNLKNNRIIFTSKKDHSMYEALNRGINESKGEVIGWLGADDQLIQGSLEKVAQVFNDQNVHWLAGEGKFLFESKDNKTTDHRLPNVITAKQIVNRNLLMSPSVYFRKSFFKTVSGFNESYKLAADYDLWIKFALQENPFVLHHALSLFSYNGMNASSRRKIEMYNETIHILQSLKQKNLYMPRMMNTLRMYGYITVNKIIK
jgi:glycosyltransferase